MLFAGLFALSNVGWAGYWDFAISGSGDSYSDSNNEKFFEWTNNQYVINSVEIPAGYKFKITFKEDNNPDRIWAGQAWNSGNKVIDISEGGNWNVYDWGTNNDDVEIVNGGTYKFTLTTSQDSYGWPNTLKIERLKASTPSTPSEVYVIGYVKSKDWTGQDKLSSDMKLTRQSDGSYKGTFQFYKPSNGNDSFFRFWDATNSKHWGPNNDQTSVSLNGTNTNISDKENAWKISPGFYEITLSSDLKTFTLKKIEVNVSSGDPLWVRYFTGIDNWSGQGEKKITVPASGKTTTVQISAYMGTNQEFGFQTSDTEKFLVNTWFGKTQNISNGSVASSFDNATSNFKWTGGFGLVTATLTIDSNGKITKAVFTGPAAKSTSVSGMPFYPKGITTEAEFNKIGTNEAFYYLVGHALNNNMPSPEWQMDNKNGIYEITFTFNHHWAWGDNSEKHCPEAVANNNEQTEANLFKVKIQRFYRNSTSGEQVKEINLKDYRKDKWDWAGVRLKLTYNPSNGTVEVKYVDYNDNVLATQNGENGKYLPFVSLIGSDWKQPHNVPRNIANAETGDTFNGWRTTEKGWQQAWIQYDAQGNPIVSRDGQKVYFNTQWPPKNKITFVASDDDDNEVLLSSKDLTFTTDGTSKSGSAWKDDPLFKNNSNFEPVTGCNYVMYKVSDMWMVGKFKVWTGWNGDRFDAGDAGAEWSNNWNWGHHSENATGTKTSLAKSPGTVKLSTKNGDMSFDKPTYFKNVYFFLDTNDPNTDQAKHCFLYFETAYASILADSNDDYSMGIFQPSLIDVPEGYHVSNVKLDLYKDSNDELVGNLWNKPVSGTSVTTDASFKSLFDGKFAPTDDFWVDGHEYEESGQYYYRMTVTFTNASGATITAPAKSNPFLILNAAVNLTTGQLVKDDKNAYPDYDYVTYSTSKAYGVKMNGNNVEKVEELSKLPTREFYENNTWTNQVILYAPQPNESNNANWTVNENTMGNGSGDLMVIVDQNDINKAYNVAYNFKIDGVEDDLSVSTQRSRVLRIPTPRLQSGYRVDIQDVAETSSVEVGTYRGATRAVDEYNSNSETTYDHSYDNARLRSMTVNATIEKPNANEGLVNVFANKGTYSARITDNFEQQEMSSNTKKNAVQSKDANIGLSNDYTVAFTNQNVMSWIRNTQSTVTGQDAYEGLKHTLSFDFTANGDAEPYMYVRNNPIVEIKLDSSFGKPNLNGNANTTLNSGDVKGYIYYGWEDGPNGKEDSRLMAYLYLTAFPKIQTATSTIGNVTLSIDQTNNMPYYAFGVGVDDKNAETNRLVGTEGLWSEDAALIDHEFLTTQGSTSNIPALAATSVLVQKQPANYMGEKCLEKMVVGIGHSYFFQVKEDITFSPVTSSAKAPRKVVASVSGAEKIAFVPELDQYDIPVATINNTNDMPTGVENVEMGSLGIQVGKGFINMNGNDGSIYSIDGKHIYTGNGYVEVEAGVYVITSSGNSAKVLVK